MKLVATAFMGFCCAPVILPRAYAFMLSLQGQYSDGEAGPMIAHICSIYGYILLFVMIGYAAVKRGSKRREQ